jgi:hypothetical protein
MRVSRSTGQSLLPLALAILLIGFAAAIPTGAVDGGGSALMGEAIAAQLPTVASTPTSTPAGAPMRMTAGTATPGT